MKNIDLAVYRNLLCAKSTLTTPHNADRKTMAHQHSRNQRESAILLWTRELWETGKKGTLVLLVPLLPKPEVPFLQPCVS